jgi:hypothetical protein
MNEKHARILGELAEFGLNLARKLHDQAMAAEAPEETAELARAFHSVSRSVRQTLALEARLQRDAARQDREDRDEAERRDRSERYDAERAARAPFEERKKKIGNVLERLVWSEHEDDEAENLFDDIYERLKEDSHEEGFLDHAIDDQIERLCAEFGLTPPERRVAVTPPAQAPWPDPPDWAGDPQTESHARSP